MTKRKRSPPAPQQRAFEIPASLQRLSNISRSLAKQSDGLAGTKEADKNPDIISQARALANGAPSSTPAVPKSRAGAVKQGSAFRGFVEAKQPSFPDTQTWVEPKPRSTPVAPTYAGHIDEFTPNGLPTFPEGQKWVTTRSNPGPIAHVVGPTAGLVPIAQPAIPQAHNASPAQPKKKAVQNRGVEAQGAKSAKVPRPPKEETLCMATEPDKIAVLVAQKRAENEANRKREALARKQATQSQSNEPDDQLINELNETLDHQLRYVIPSTATRQKGLNQLEPYPSVDDAIVIDPASPDIGEADTDHDSLFNSVPTSSAPANPASSSSHNSPFSSETSSPAPELLKHQLETQAPAPVLNQPSTNSEANSAKSEPARVRGHYSQIFKAQPRAALASWQVNAQPPKPHWKAAM